MPRIMLLLLLSLLIGCGTGTETESSIVPPELVTLSPLPPYRAPSVRPSIKLDMLILVTKEGLVEDAKLQGSSGDPEWDSLALKAVRQWQFTPPTRNGQPTDLWIRQQVTVQFQEPILLTLAEIICSTQQDGDTLYQMLEQGADFAALARQTGRSPSNAPDGYLGTVDISLYPPQVREALRSLSVGETTKPIRLGAKYVIFKRMSSPASQAETPASVGDVRVVPLEWMGTKQ